MHLHHCCQYAQQQPQSCQRTEVAKERLRQYLFTSLYHNLSFCPAKIATFADIHKKNLPQSYQASPALPPFLVARKQRNAELLK
jgi:hypothetical protein